MKAFKAVIYSLGGVLQFVLAFQQPRMAVVFVPLGIALIGLGVINLNRLVKQASLRKDA